MSGITKAFLSQCSLKQAEMPRPRLRVGMSVVLALACLVTAGVARASDDAAAKIVSVSPTVFFVKEKDSLWQQAELVVENGAAEQELTIDIKAGSAQRSLSLGKVKPGKTTHAILVPDVPTPTSVTCTLKAGDKMLDSQAIDWRPGRHWRIFYVPVTHHDLGYTDTIENVLEQYNGFYDNVVRFCEETEDWPEESRYHYTAEGAWSLQHYVRNRPEAAIAKLRKYVGQGRIEIPALYGNEISGLCGHEELVRLMYPSFQLKRQLGGEIRTGSITDIPGVSWGLPTVLSGVGVKYFFAGFPTYFQWSGQNVHEFWDASAVLRHGRPDAFRWEGPDGGSVLLYYQGSYGMLAGGVGPNSYKEIFDDLPATLEDMQQRGSPFDVARFIHNGVDNYPPDVRISHVAREWNDRWAYPRLIVATNTMFFEALEKQCGDVRVFRGEVPHTDYAVGATSTAKETCVNRGTHDRLPTAEKFATMAWLLADYPRPPAEGKWVRELSSYDNPTRKLGDAYDNMLLYDEHTWGMAHPAGVRQDWNWSDKSHYAYRAAGLASSILDGSVHALADRVRLKEDGRHIVVFNPLSLARSDVVRVSGEFGEEPFELVDVETGTKVPGQFVRLDNPLAPLPYAADRHGRGQFSPAELFDFVFVAENVPPMGWKTYRFMPVKTAAPAVAPVQVGDGTLENRFFKITLDPKRGTIRSIIDKELQRELVDQDAPHQLNQLIVRRVADGKLESPAEATNREGAERAGVFEPGGNRRGLRLSRVGARDHALRPDQADRPGQPRAEGLDADRRGLLRVPLQDGQARVPLRGVRQRHQAAAGPVARLELELLLGAALGRRRRRQAGRDAHRRRFASDGIRRAVAVLRFAGAPRRHGAGLRPPLRHRGRHGQGPRVRLRAGQQFPHELSHRPAERPAVSLLDRRSPGRLEDRLSSRLRLGGVQPAGARGRRRHARGSARAARELLRGGRSPTCLC